MSGTGIEATLAGTIWPPRPAVAADAVAKRVKASSRFARDVVLCLIGTALLASSAKVSVPLLPVPMTLQPLAVMCIGAAAAWAKGVAPFILGDALKAALAAALVRASWSLLGSKSAR
jgi:biotin transporter BioY